MQIKNSVLLHILNSIKLFCVYLFVLRKAHHLPNNASSG